MMKNKEATSTLTFLPLSGGVYTLSPRTWMGHWDCLNQQSKMPRLLNALLGHVCWQPSGHAVRKPVEARREFIGGYPHRPGQQPWLRSQITTSLTRRVSEYIFTWFQSPRLWVYLTVAPAVMEQRWVIHCVVSSLNSLPPNPWANLLCSRGLVALCH